jgi:hypothetical protein
MPKVEPRTLSNQLAAIGRARADVEHIVLNTTAPWFGVRVAD